jgi:hypothetical protein
MNNSSKLTIAALIVLAGCQTIASADDVPARITNPSDASRAALQQAVNDALHTDVMLANNALTDSSILIIERSPPRTMQGLPATGRNMDPPIQFKLVVNDSDCILIDTRDETRHLLENTACIAE